MYDEGMGLNKLRGLVRTLLKMIVGFGRANFTNATLVMNDTSTIAMKDSTAETQLEHEFVG